MSLPATDHELFLWLVDLLVDRYRTGSAAAAGRRTTRPEPHLAGAREGQTASLCPASRGFGLTA